MTLVYSASLRFYVLQHNQFQFDGPEFVVQADYFILHHNYNPRNFENDICMVHAASEIDFQTGATTACLPDKGDFIVPGVECYVAGWGKKSFTEGMYDKNLIIIIIIINYC